MFSWVKISLKRVVPFIEVESAPAGFSCLLWEKWWTWMRGFRVVGRNDWFNFRTEFKILVGLLQQCIRHLGISGGRSDWRYEFRRISYESRVKTLNLLWKSLILRRQVTKGSPQKNWKGAARKIVWHSPKSGSSSRVKSGSGIRKGSDLGRNHFSIASVVRTELWNPFVFKSWLQSLVAEWPWTGGLSP